MYGLDIPAYAREYLKEWRRDDPKLRLRMSIDVPGAYVLERSSVYRFPAADEVERGTDRAIQLAHGYRTVVRFWPNEIKYVKRHLWLTDIHRRGGAKAVDMMMDDLEEKETELLDRAFRTESDAAASELYDMLAWEEKRRVAVA